MGKDAAKRKAACDEQKSGDGSGVISFDNSGAHIGYEWLAKCLL